SAEAQSSGKRTTIPLVQALLDDPRLAEARSFERTKDWASAAKAVHDARPIDLSGTDACAWDYLEGRLLMLANATPAPGTDGAALLPQALAAFERAEQAHCPLSGYARLHAGQVLARSGHADEAIARARAVPEDLTTLSDDVKILIAESLAAKGDRAAALPLWR